MTSMKMSHSEKKCDKLLSLASIFVIYDQIISSLDVLSSNYVLSYTHIPLKEVLDLPFKKTYSGQFASSLTCFHKLETLFLEIK